jgi:hypothetical protein
MAADRKYRRQRNRSFVDLTGGLLLQLPPIDWWEQTEPLTLLPSQTRREPELCSCRKLVAAVLADAYLAITRPPPGQAHRFERTRRETLAWFAVPDAEVSVNLRDCCEGLGLDVGRMQKAAERVTAGAPVIQGRGTR